MVMASANLMVKKKIWWIFFFVYYRLVGIVALCSRKICVTVGAVNVVLANADCYSTSTKGLNGGMLAFLSQIVRPLPSLVHKLYAPPFFTKLCACLPFLLACACSYITTHPHPPSVTRTCSRHHHPVPTLTTRTHYIYSTARAPKHQPHTHSLHRYDNIVSKYRA